MQWIELTKIMHSWVKPMTKTWISGPIEDAPDGSGDGILTFPPGMCEELGWKEGDKIKISVEEPGAIILEKIE